MAALFNARVNGEAIIRCIGLISAMGKLFGLILIGRERCKTREHWGRNLVNLE